MKSSLGISNFLEEIFSLSHSLVFLISLHWTLRKAFLSLLDSLWNSAFKWVYLSFSPLHFTSLLFTAIWPMPLLETPGHLRASLSQSLVWSLLLSPGPREHKVLFVPSESVSPVLCKLWGLYGGVNGDLLQEGLYHTQVYCTQSPCPCKVHCWPPHEMLKQFCHSLCGVSVSWCTQRLLESPEHLWQVWALILNTISPLLLSCWGFSFALGHGVSPQPHSSATQLPLHC